MSRTLPRVLSPEHRLAIRRQLKLEADAGRFNPLRNRALFMLAWTSALRLNEVLALTVGQVLELQQPALPRRRAVPRKGVPPAPPRWRVRSSSYVRVDQAKGGRERALELPKYDVDGSLREPRQTGRSWTSAGTIVISATARRALNAYVRHAVKAGALELNEDAPLWVRRSSGEGFRKRTVQYQWDGLQGRAGIPELDRYHFHCLRHDSLSLFARACGGDVFKVAAFGRCDPYTAQRYVNVEPKRLGELADRAAALR